MSKRDTVDFRLEGELTPEQIDELRRLEAMGDTGIDTAAIPPAPAEAWRHARRGPVTQAELTAMRRFFRPVKEPVSIRLDADVVALVQGARARLADRDQQGAARAYRAKRVAHYPCRVRSSLDDVARWMDHPAYR